MRKVVTKRGFADWADLQGKDIEFDWSDGYEDYWPIRMTFDRTSPYFEDPRYPRYYVLGEGGGGYSFWEDDDVKVTVHESERPPLPVRDEGQAEDTKPPSFH